MKTARISLAVVSGLLLAFGYAAGSGHDRMSDTKIIIGLMFGAFLAFSLIRRLDRNPRFTIWFVAALLLWLVIDAFRSGPWMEAVTTAVISLAFLGVQIALMSLPAEPNAASAAEADVAAPAVKE